MLAGCLKLAALKTVVFTIPSKERGLRIQSSDIILGEPGVGKGQAFQWRDDIMEDTKKMLLKYANDEMKNYLQAVPDRQPEGEKEENGPECRAKFKYVDGIERSLPQLFFLAEKAISKA